MNSIVVLAAALSATPSAGVVQMPPRVHFAILCPGGAWFDAVSTVLPLRDGKSWEVRVNDQRFLFEQPTECPIVLLEPAPAATADAVQWRPQVLSGAK